LTVEDDPHPVIVKETKTLGGLMKKKQKPKNNETPAKAKETPTPVNRFLAKQPTATFMDITPKLAKEMLAFNTNNRRLRRDRVKTLADEMSRKQWLSTGEAIKFDTSGVLIDGQHRLEGCVEANITLKQQLVVTGVTEDAFAVIDSGLKRSPNDVLSHAGFANGSAIAPAARLVSVIDAGLNPLEKRARGLVTRQDVLKWTEENTESIDWALRLARIVYDQGGIGNRTALIALAMMAEKQGHSRERIEQFFSALGTGEGLSASSPILALRSWMIKSGQKLGGGSSVIHLSNSIAAFNNWDSGKVVRRHSPLTANHEVPALCKA